MAIGTIVIWHPARDFGFIETADTPYVYLHARYLAEEFEVAVGQLVEFEILPGGPNARNRAGHVRLLEAAQ